jgi:hypothetical protein
MIWFRWLCSRAVGHRPAIAGFPGAAPAAIPDGAGQSTSLGVPLVIVTSSS